MKISPILALLAVCAPVVAPAQTATTPDVAALPIAPASAATSDVFVWRFAPPVGSKWTMRSFVRSISIAPLDSNHKDQFQKTTAVQRFTADYDVLSRDRFGATTIRLTYRDAFDYTLSVPIDSDISMSGPMERADTKAIDGATLTFKQGPDGRVWSVVGVRAFLRHSLRVRTLADEETIRQFLDSPEFPSNKEFVEVLNQGRDIFPTSPLRVGESWSYSTAFPNQILQIPDIEVRGKRTLKVLNAEIASIATNARFDNGKPNSQTSVASDRLQAVVDYSRLSGTITGNSRVERSSGLALETNASTALKGRVTTRLREPDGALAEAQETVVNVTSTTRIVMQPR